MTDKPTPLDKPLTPKQAKFAEEYIKNGGNGILAYRLAYDASGMNDVSVAKESMVLRRHPRIAPLLAVVARKAAKGVEEAIAEFIANAAETAKNGMMGKADLIASVQNGMVEAGSSKNWQGFGRLSELLARLQGWVVEPTRNVRVIRSMADLSEAELSVLAGEDGAGDSAVKH